MQHIITITIDHVDDETVDFFDYMVGEALEACRRSDIDDQVVHITTSTSYPPMGSSDSNNQATQETDMQPITINPIHLGESLKRSYEAIQDHITNNNACPCCGAGWEGDTMNHLPNMCDYVAVGDALTSVDLAVDEQASDFEGDVSELLTVALEHVDQARDEVVEGFESWVMRPDEVTDHNQTMAHMIDEAEMLALRDTVDELTTMLNDRVEEVSNLRRTIADLRQGERGMSQTIRNMQADLAGDSQVIAKFQVERTNYLDMISNFRRTIADLQQTVRTLESDVAAYDAWNSRDRVED